jgi:hypothetical protein
MSIAQTFRAAGLKEPSAQMVSFSLPLNHHLLATGQFITMLPASMLQFGKASAAQAAFGRHAGNSVSDWHSHAAEPNAEPLGSDLQRLRPQSRRHDGESAVVRSPSRRATTPEPADNPRSSCSCFASSVLARKLTPVILPPGRFMLATRPNFTGCDAMVRTMLFGPTRYIGRHCAQQLETAPSRSEPTRMASAGSQLRALNRLRAEALANLPVKAR